MSTFEIKNRNTGAVIYSGGGESLREVVIAAVKSGADLSSADLRGAYLSSAHLSSADLRGADLRSADLRGAYLSSTDLRGADLSSAYLRSADLRSADLRGADLSGADLSGAYLSGKKLIGIRPIYQIGPIGSRSDYLVAYLTDAGIMIAAGCFFGTRDEITAAVQATHGDNEHGREYRAALALIDAHAEIWAPKEEG